ncbi:MAG: hypothetical protein K0R51_671 [Cytophagaceae bacterium]|jgi:tetratricopeptide (TPR) repeat protein|nr:hypothetical protein [Cytophagaceae bacterium]
MNKSNKYLDKNEYEKALLYINKAIQEDSSNPSYYHNRSIIHSYLRDFNQAVTDEQKALALAPDEHLFNNGMAAAYQRRGRIEDSSLILHYYNEAIKLDRTNATYYFNRALFLESQDKTKEALRDFYLAQKLDPSMSDAYYEIGSIKSMDMQYFSEAIEDFDKAIKMKPTEAKYYHGRGECFYKMGDMDKASKDCEKALALAPDNSSALLLKASLYEVTGKVEEAVKILDQVISKDTLAWDAYNNRGIIKLFWIKQYESGIADLKKAFAINPNAPMIHNNIGLGYSTLERYEEAIPEFDLAIKEMPESSFAYNNRGYAKFKMNDTDGAFTDILQSIRLDPSNSYAFRNRALIYLELKRKEDACLDLMRAKELKFATFYGTEVQELIDKHCSK